MGYTVSTKPYHIKGLATNSPVGFKSAALQKLHIRNQAREGGGGRGAVVRKATTLL